MTPRVIPSGVAFPHPVVSIREVRLPRSHFGRLERLPRLALPRNDLVEFVQRFTSVAVPHEEGNSVERSVFATIVAAPHSRRPGRYQSCCGAVSEGFTRPAENKCLGGREQMFGMMRTD